MEASVMKRGKKPGEIGCCNQKAVGRAIVEPQTHIHVVGWVFDRADDLDVRSGILA
jgi:hypothetical protein